MKYESTTGATWRNIFRKMLWVSVVCFEIIGIIIGLSLGNDLSAKLNIPSDSGMVVIILIIITVTVMNSAIHSIWGCVAYMFDDIAANRAATIAILERLEQMENGEKTGSVTNHTSSNNSTTQSYHKTPRPLSERMAQQKPAAPQETWVCRECGRINPSIANFCKDCGKYK